MPNMLREGLADDVQDEYVTAGIEKGFQMKLAKEPSKKNKKKTPTSWKRKVAPAGPSGLTTVTATAQVVLWGLELRWWG